MFHVPPKWSHHNKVKKMFSSTTKRNMNSEHVCLVALFIWSVCMIFCFKVVSYYLSVPHKRFLLKSSSSNLSMVTATDMRMPQVLIIQGHTYLNHKNNKCSIISETVQAPPITFAVKIIRLKVYEIVSQFSDLQGHNCISNLIFF